jgi:hypothetical protein
MEEATYFARKISGSSPLYLNFIKKSLILDMLLVDGQILSMVENRSQIRPEYTFCVQPPSYR